MRDGPLRRLLKAAVRGVVGLDLALHRAWLRARGHRPYTLGGACAGCARCCEQPSIQVGRLTWYLPTLRRLFVGWQRVVNGFELVRRERPRVLVFRCTHFDPAARRCDSYDSRPVMCRDYPRLLLWQATPTLFEGCGYRAVDPAADALHAALADRLDGDALREARRKLYLEEPPDGA